MILSLLFIFLFIAIIAFFLIFIFSILLPSMKSEGIEIKSPIFSLAEKNYNEDIFYSSRPGSSSVCTIDKEAVTLNDSMKKRINYKGVINCAMFYNSYETQYLTLEKKCIGYGDCVNVCQQKALFIKNNFVAINNMCAGCGKCIEVCPVNILSMAPKSENKSEIMSKDFKFWKKWYRILHRVGK